MLSSEDAVPDERRNVSAPLRALKFINTNWDIVTSLPGGFRLSDSGIEIQVGKPVLWAPAQRVTEVNGTASEAVPEQDSKPALLEDLSLIVENHTLTSLYTVVEKTPAASAAKVTQTPSKVSSSKPPATAIKLRTT